MASKKSTSTTKTITVAQVAKVVAERTETDAAIVAKKLRARIRSNFEKLAPQWPGLTEAKENRDGNRYPPMPAALGEALVTAMTAKVKAES